MNTTDFIKSLINTGLRKEPDLIIYNNYIRMANFNGVLFLLIDLALSFVFYYFIQDYYLAKLLLLSAVAFFCSSIGLNYFGFYNLSRLSTVSIGSLLVTFCAFYLGKEANVTESLLLGAIFPFVYFSTKEKINLFICIVIPLLCYALLLYYNYNLGPQIIIEKSQNLMIIQIIFFILPFIGIVANTYTAVSELESKALSVESSKKTLETIFYGLAHDLSNPVQTSLLVTEVVQKNKTFDPTRMNILQKNFKQISKILTHLKNIAMSSNGQFKFNISNHNLLDIIHSALETVTDQSEAKKIQFNIEIDPRLFTKIDKEVFSFQVIKNFLTNSIKFSESGSTIFLSSRITDGELYFVIQDFGVGMSETKINQLFSWEYATSTVGTSGENGSGLGMPIAYNFLKALNCDVNIVSTLKDSQSNQQSGTTIFIKLPKIG